MGRRGVDHNSSGCLWAWVLELTSGKMETSLTGMGSGKRKPLKDVTA